MGTLANPRHEKFARLVWAASAKDYRRALAYLAAGYRAKLDLSDPSRSWPRDQRRLIVRGIGTSKVSCTRESASKRGSGGNYGQSETMRHARRTQRSRQ